MTLRIILAAAVITALVLGQSPRFRILNEQIPPTDTGFFQSNVSGYLGGTADFDGDGDLDVLTPRAILVNDGNGRFSVGPQFASWMPGFGLEIAGLGDVNGDGRADVVVPAGQGSGVFLNDGALGFLPGPALPPPPVSAWGLQFGIALGDVDGDGDLDACIAASGGVLLVPAFLTAPIQPMLWLNDGSGTFTDVTATMLPAITPLVDRIAMRDFDQDGDLDVFLWRTTTYPPYQAPNPPSAHILLRNGGGGTFTQVVSVPGPGVGAVAVLGDFNGDGLPDVAYSTLDSTPSDGIVLNLGAASFAPYVPAPWTGSTRMLAADLSGNGTDLLIRSGAGSLTVSSVSPAGVLNPPSQVISTDGTPGVAGDLDGDLDVDVVAAAYDGSRLLLNDGAGNLVPIAGNFNGPGAGGYAAAVGDVDADGDADCVYTGTYAAGSPFTVARNDGHGVFQHDPTFCAGGCPPILNYMDRLFPLDFDGDGDMDLYYAGATDTLFVNSGSGWTPSYSIALGGFTSMVRQGDLDGDGDLDLVVGRRSSLNPPYQPATSFIALNVGGGAFVLGNPLPITVAVAGLVLFDADGDQDLDIAVAGIATTSFPTPPSSGIYVNDGAGNFTVPAGGSSLPVSGSVSVSAGDLDLDGDADIVIDSLTSTGTAQVVVFFKVAAGSFNAAQVITVPYPASLRLGTELFDADGDGDLDFGTLSSGPGGLWINNGAGVFATTETLPPLLASSANDFDGDGDLDLLGYGPRVFTNVSRQIARGSLARPGRPWSLELFGPPAMPYLLFASPGTASVPLPPLGTVFIDPVTAFQVAAGFFPASGLATPGAPIPNNPALIGQTIYWQAAIPSQLRLTNRETTTVTGL